MKISNEVLQILDQCRTDGGLLYLPGQLDRKSYEAVNKILVAAGGKWNRKAGAHVFEGYAAEAIEGVMLTGEIADAKRDFGFFPTPAGVVDILLDRAEIKPHHTALEPQAGRGAIAFPLALACAAVDVVELLAENFITLDGPFRRAAWKDFLTIDPDEWGERYDRIVMNPHSADRPTSTTLCTPPGSSSRVAGWCPSWLPASISGRTARPSIFAPWWIPARAG